MRVLQLSTHTTLLPRHGGKLRSHHIGRVIEKAGFSVQRLAFCFRALDDLDDEREPIVDVATSPFWGGATHMAFGAAGAFLTDYLPTVAALESPGLLARFDAEFQKAAPEVVLLEHPWTWPLIERFPEVRSRRIRVLYSSQNVELHLKREILRRAEIIPAAEVLEGIDQLERGLVTHADAVITCTAADAEVFRGWGARRTIVAPNGGVRGQRGHLRDILPTPLEPAHAYALVVGSAHPPNISGFLHLVAPWLPRLRPGERVAIAGGAGEAIRAEVERAGLRRMMEGRVIILGVLDDLSLDCAIANARVLMVPIEYGGGSNVKTAEALLSGRPIVATSAALRGFPFGPGVPGLDVADTAEAFGEAVLGRLETPSDGVAANHPALAGLLWEATIAPLVEFLREPPAAAAGRPAAIPSPEVAAEPGRGD